MNSKAKKFQVPHVYIILLGIILICSILSYIIPAGAYQMMTLDSGREVVDPSTFERIAQTPVGLMDFLSAIPRGLNESASIIFFIMIVGGSFTILQDTGAIEAALGRVVKKLKGKEILLIPIIMIAFSFGSATIGMAEEALPFVPIVVSLAIAAGFDSMVGAAIIVGASGVGFAGAFINPFTIGIAQGIADLPMLSGMPLRIVLYCTLNVVSIAFIYRYAMKIKKNPELSVVRDIDQKREDLIDMDNLKPFGIKEKLIIVVLVITMGLLMYGVVKKGWYFTEIASLFFGMAIVVACIKGLGFNGFAQSLSKGAESLASCALIVGIARGILVTLTDGNILHPILYYAANFLSHLPTTVTAVGMYIFQCLLNFLVPSGSGQAVVSMPVLAPLSDMVGVTRQTAVLAFQLGDGLSNVLTPTSGYFMAGLGLARIPWDRWVKWFWPLLLVQYLIGVIFVVFAQMTQYGPF